MKIMFNLFKKPEKPNLAVTDSDKYINQRFELLESRLVRLEKLLYFVALVSLKGAFDFVNNFL